MNTDREQEALHRPNILDFEDPVDFVKAMIDFRKNTEKKFSVLSATSALRKISPTLISLILSRKRKITMDRMEEFSKLLRLNVQEKIYFKNWIEQEGKRDKNTLSTSNHNRQNQHQRKEVGTSLLSDWINVYVKDCFQLPKVQERPELVHRYLASYADQKRVEKSLQFLLKEGHLRRTLEGKIVVESNLAVADPQVPNKKIRQFHKGALGIAKTALELFPPEERLANTLVIPLNEKSYGELLELIYEFSEKLQTFAAQNQEKGDRLYQLILNLSPAGGKIE
ncbi:MAG: TIGR02147 family protein [Pseudobdellovibrionaceae bacterium]